MTASARPVRPAALSEPTPVGAPKGAGSAASAAAQTAALALALAARDGEAPRSPAAASTADTLVVTIHSFCASPLSSSAATQLAAIVSSMFCRLRSGGATPSSTLRSEGGVTSTVTPEVETYVASPALFVAATQP